MSQLLSAYPKRPELSRVEAQPPFPIRNLHKPSLGTVVNQRTARAGCSDGANPAKHHADTMHEGTATNKAADSQSFVLQFFQTKNAVLAVLPNDVLRLQPASSSYRGSDGGRTTGEPGELTQQTGRQLPRCPVLSGLVCLSGKSKLHYAEGAARA